MTDQGWIKLHRKTLENPVFKKPFIWHYFQYCLLKANHKENEIMWNGKKVPIERGSFITGRYQAAVDTGLSEQNTRTARTTLERQGMIRRSTTKSTNKFSYLTVCNYGIYQDSNSNGNQQTNHQSTSNQPQTIMNKNEKKNLYKEFILLSKKEHEKLVNKLGKDLTNDYIDRVNNYIGQKGKSYKSHYHTILAWHRKDEGQNRPSRPTGVVL